MGRVFRVIIVTFLNDVFIELLIGLNLDYTENLSKRLKFLKTKYQVLLE